MTSDQGFRIESRHGERRFPRKLRKYEIVIGAINVAVLAAAAAFAVGSLGGGTSVAATHALNQSFNTRANKEFGVTHTQDDADSYEPATAVANAKRVLTASSIFQNQPIMGWGTLNPEPSPGTFDWTTLDRRVQLIESTGGTPVLTLCGAPDWMKGGRAGHTNWSRLDVAPNPKHYKAFAQLAVAVAKRYPSVHYFQVWNELKGFYSVSQNNWKIADYTKMYNDVYRALKAYNPKLKIGGPYAVITSWQASSAGGHPSEVTGPWGTLDQRDLDAVTYWLHHKAGAQFLTVDGSTAPRDNPYPTDAATDLGKVTAVMDWLRGQTNLPIWWSEAYAGLPPKVSETSTEASRFYTAMSMRLAAGGASRVLFWDAQQYANSASPGIYTSTTKPTGGTATPFDADVDKLNQIVAGRDLKLRILGNLYILTSSTGRLTVTV